MFKLRNPKNLTDRMENWRNAGEHDKLGFNWSIYENMGQDIILNK